MVELREKVTDRQYCPSGHPLIDGKCIICDGAKNPKAHNTWGKKGAR